MSGPAVDTGKRLEALYDHYKESAAAFDRQIKQRMWLSYAAFLVMALMMLDLRSSNLAQQLLAAGLTKLSGGEIKVEPQDVRLAVTLLWFLLAGIVLQYYARSITIARLVSYLRVLEARLGELGGGAFVTQHTDAKATRPRLLRHADYAYSFFFVTLISLVAAVRLPHETATADDGWTLVLTLVDYVLAAVIVYFSALFVVWARKGL